MNDIIMNNDRLALMQKCARKKPNMGRHHETLQTAQIAEISNLSTNLSTTRQRTEHVQTYLC
jgi:hypothetical protein